MAVGTNALRRAELIVIDGYYLFLALSVAGTTAVITLGVLSQLSGGWRFALAVPVLLGAFVLAGLGVTRLDLVVGVWVDRFIDRWFQSWTGDSYADRAWRIGKLISRPRTGGLPVVELTSSRVPAVRKDAADQFARMAADGLSADQLDLARQLADEGFQGTFDELAVIARQLA